MPLSNFAVVRDHSFRSDATLINCFDGRQLVLVVVAADAIDGYFRRSDLTPQQRNLLVDRNLQTLVPMISDKYDRGLTRMHVSGAQSFPTVELTVDDLRGVPGGLTDSVLTVAAAAGFGGSPRRLSRLSVVSPSLQPIGFVMLTCADGDQQVEVSVSGTDLDDLMQGRGWDPLEPSAAAFLVEINLENLAPIIEAKYQRGEVAHHTSLISGAPVPVIELTRGDLGQGITQFERLVPRLVEVDRIWVDVRQGGVTTPGGSMPRSFPTPPDRRARGHIYNVPVLFKYLQDEVTAVVVGSAEAANRLPGFEPLPGEPVEIQDESTDARDATPVVFISCKREDADVAQRLATALAGVGLASWSFGHVFEQRRRLPMPERIDEMIRLSKAVVAIISDKELGVNVVAEIGIARANSTPVIALRTADVDFRVLPNVANSYIDASADWDAAIDEVVKAISAPRPLRPRPDPNVSGAQDRLTPTKKSRKGRPPKSVAQRPAAYRFRTTDDKIDVLPEPPPPLDRQLAADTQRELTEKAQHLLARLQGTNSAQRVCDSVQRLIDALDVPFDELRPGVLLSRVRSLEADGTAFDTDDARAELFPDAFARVSDTVQTARDLLGSFPQVRQIEVERVALDLHRLPANALTIIEDQARQIQEAAQASGAVTADAVRALAQNDAAINAATSQVLHVGLFGDKLLVVANFARAVAETGWAKGLNVGVGMALTAAPLMVLGYSIAGRLGALAMIPAFGPLSRLYAKTFGDNAKATRVSKAPRAGTIALAKRGAPRRRQRKMSKPALPRAALEAFFLSEARKTHEWSHLDILQIKPGSSRGSWEIESWGQSAAKSPRDGLSDIQNIPILNEIQKRLSDQFSLGED